mgnify:CR=1 FL=1
MPETTPLIKAALNLRVGAGFDVYDDSVTGSSNFGKFIKLFESDDSGWIDKINRNLEG